MRRLSLFIIILSLSLALISCGGGGGRSATVDGVAIKYTESLGEFDRSAFNALDSALTVGGGKTVTASFEYAAESAGVTAYPLDGGEPFELPYSQSGYTLSFKLPEASGEYGFNIEYTIDESTYNMTFRINIS